MTSKRRPHPSRVSLAVVLALLAAATGCEIVATFDRSKIPTELDSGLDYDGAYPDGSGGEDVAAASTREPTRAPPRPARA